MAAEVERLAPPRVAPVDEERLRVLEMALAGSRVPRVADGQVTGQAVEHPVVDGLAGVDVDARVPAACVIDVNR